MAKIPGTNVASPIAPFTTDDQFPTHDAIYGKGGQREVATIAERDAIPSARLTEGCTCYVAATEKTYRWKSNAWVDDTPEIASDASDISYTPSGSSTPTNVAVALDGKASTSALTEGLAGKQGTINDLEAIRSGAGKGATSVQGVKMEGDNEPLTPDVNGVVTVPQPEIPDSVTSVIANNELVFQTPDGQSVKGKVGITTGADGLLHLTLTDEEGHVYSSPIAGLRVVGNALQYSNDGVTWVTVQTFGKLAIKYAQASDPASGDEGDLALVGTMNAYVLKVYVGGSWVSVCDFGTLDLTSDCIKMAGESKTLTEKEQEYKDILDIQSQAGVESTVELTLVNGKYIKSDGTVGTSGTASYSQPIAFKDGDVISYSIGGSGAAIIAECVEEDVRYTPLVLATTNKTYTGTYQVVGNKRLSFCGFTAQFYYVRFERSSNDSERLKGIEQRLDDVEQSFEDVEGSISDIENILYPSSKAEELTDWVTNAQIQTNASVGSKSPLTIVTPASTRYLVVNCEEGDKFLLNGLRGMDAARLWCFTDDNAIVKGISGSNASSNNLEITAPLGATRLYVNDDLLSGTCVRILKDSLSKALDDISELQSRVSNVEQSIDVKETISWQQGMQIQTAAEIGEIPSLNKVSGSTRCIDISCKEGDKFYLEDLLGYVSARLWCFLDNENRVVDISSENASVSTLDLTVPPSAVRLIVNDGRKTGNLKKIITPRDLNEEIDANEKDSLELIEWEEHKQIYTAAAVGSRPSFAVYSGDSIKTRCFDIDCSRLVAVYITASGMIGSRLWCFLDRNNKVVSVSESNAYGNNLKVPVPEGAVRLIVNDNHLSEDLQENVFCYAKYDLSRISKTIEKMVNGENSFRRISACKFFGEQPAADGLNEVFTLNGNAGHGYDELITFYDSLKVAHPNEIKKVELGYDASGTIITYAYEFSPAYYSQVIILQAGIHATEITAVLALARIMQMIYDDDTTDEDLTFLRQRCKFVVIPCMNAWGYSQNPRSVVTSNGSNTQTWNADTCVEIVNIKTYLSDIAPVASFMLDMHTTGGGQNYLDFYGNMQRDGKNLSAIFRANEWLCNRWAQEGRTVKDQLLGYFDSMTLCRYYFHVSYGLETSTLEFSDGRWEQSRISSGTMTKAVTMWLNYIVQQADDFYKTITQDIASDLKPGTL